MKPKPTPTKPAPIIPEPRTLVDSAQPSQNALHDAVSLIAAILDSLCSDGSPFIAYPLRGVDVLQCRYCRAIGRIEGGQRVNPEHRDDCAIVLNEQLQAMVSSEQK